MKNCTELTSCVACGSNNLRLTLDLDSQPLANSYKLKQDDLQEEYSLAINRCEECYHIQLTHSVDPHLMFDDYLYVSGIAKTGHEYFDYFAKYANEQYPEAKTVFDIGCNDGTQLDYFKKLGFQTYGVDPAKNLYEMSKDNHNIWVGYFNDEFVFDCILPRENATFDIITAQNVFAHGPNPLGFLETAKKIMNDNTLMFIQTSQAYMIPNNEFDTIYHEHISFFNIQSMDKLCRRAGLYLIDVQTVPIHGGSYVFVVSKTERSPFVKDRVKYLIEIERVAGRYTEQTYVDYANNAANIVTELQKQIDAYRQDPAGWNIVGYGAAAKGMTLLNHSKIKLDFIVDDTPLKQNRFTPGSSIPIVSAENIDNLSRTLFVPLAWNFFTEIRSKIKQRRNNDQDRFITYFPSVKITD